MRLERGICTGTETFEGCGKDGWIANRTKMLCIECNKKRLKVISPSKVQKLPTGELQIFREIWDERPHLSQVSGTPLPYFDVRCFSHILTKAAYPSLRLLKQNIVLKTPEEHEDWEFRAHRLKDKPEWRWVFELKQSLKEQYYNAQTPTQ